MFARLLSVYTIVIFSRSVASNPKEPIKCAPLKQSTMWSQSNSNENFYSFTVSVNKCGRSCNIIDDPYAWVCAPNKVKKWM